MVYYFSCCSWVIIFCRQPGHKLNFQTTKSETSRTSIRLHHFVFCASFNCAIFCEQLHISFPQTSSFSKTEQQSWLLMAMFVNGERWNVSEVRQDVLSCKQKHLGRILSPFLPKTVTHWHYLLQLIANFYFRSSRSHKVC